MNYSLRKNLLVLFFGVLFPELIADYYSLNHYNNFRFVLQYITGLVIFLSSIFIVVSSFRGFGMSVGRERKQRIIFLVVGVGFFIYISLGLAVQFSVSNISIG